MEFFCNGARKIMQKFLHKTSLFNPIMIITRCCSSAVNKEVIVLGIETSCDDTCVGVVSSKGSILADSRCSQLSHHLEYGGIVPRIAGDLHRHNLSTVMNNALKESQLEMKDITAIATTIGPGLSPCLGAGLEFVKDLIKRENKPFIPVHHMEAHALTARLTNSSISFPFLVLLVSGGHCILAVCEGFGKFYRLGESQDDSPGEALDKMARLLRLYTNPLCIGLPGGKAIEVMAKQGDASRFPLPHVMSQRLDCCFSFGGLKASAKRLVESLEKDISNLDTTSPFVYCEDMCASFQNAVCRHLLTRTERAFLYCRQKWPNLSHLIVSGGVASNIYLRERLTKLCSHYEYQLYCPKPHLCTDNGVMIAWTGVEHVLSGQPYMEDLSLLMYKPKWPLGEDISSAVTEQNIKVSNKYKRRLLSKIIL